MLIKGCIRSGQHASSSALKVFFSRGYVWYCCGWLMRTVPIFSWMGHIIAFGLALCGFSVFQRYLTVIEVKCLWKSGLRVISL